MKTAPYLLYLLAAIYLLLSIPAMAAGQAVPSRVLVLNSYHDGFPWTDDVMRAIREVLEPGEVELDVEYMDTKRLYDPAYRQLLYDLLAYKYAQRQPQVIIASDNNAYDFLRNYRDRLFPGVPVVFCGVNFFKDEQIAGLDQFTGVAEMFDAAATLRIALQQRPATREMYVIHDHTPTGMAWANTIREQLAPFDDQLAIRYTEDADMAHIRAQLTRLPADSIVLLALFFRDRHGRFYSGRESTALVADASPVPVYGLLDFFFEHGIVGGHLISGYYQGQTAAKLTMRILLGEDANAMPVIKTGANRLMFDYRQLQRFALDADSLPDGAIIEHRPASFYQQHKQLVWQVMGFVAIQTVIILFLLLNVLHRRQAEQALQEAHDTLELRVRERTAELSASETKARSLVKSLRRAQMLLDGRNHVLELLAKARPLHEVLDVITAYIESVDSEVMCSILLLDKEHLRHGSAPSLPNFYVQATNGVKIGYGVGSCGTAAYTGKRVVVADMLNHPYWSAFQELVLKTPMRACWSEPILSHDGTVLGTFAMYYRDVRKPGPEELELIQSAADLTAVVIEHTHARQALYEAEERARLLLESSMEGIVGLDIEGRVTFINPAALQLLGYEAEMLIGTNLHERIHYAQADGSLLPAAECRILAAARDGRDFHVADDVLWRRDGSHFHAEFRATPIRRHGTVIGAVVTFHDISERKKNEEKIQHLAYHDALTGLPNRFLFKEQLRWALARLKRNGESFALHFLDLDHFKDVNDTLGHPAGDALLRQVAKRLTESVRSTDTIARLGGDEFAVIQTGVIANQDTMIFADKFIRQLAEPFLLNGNLVQTHTSVGIALVDDVNLNEDDLMSRADVALYKAKEAGRGVFAFYEDTMSAQLQKELDLINRLEPALGAGELYLLYQPQVDLHSERVTGVEALLRWRHPERGELLPGEFIRLFEKRHLIGILGSWVLEEACRQCRKWRDADFHPGRLAINVSPLQFADSGMFDKVYAQIKAAGVSFDCIELELAENGFMTVSSEAMSTLEALSRQGLHFAIDDFGTGCSSLNYLHRFKVNKLKIDRKFIHHMLNDPHDAEIVKATIALGKSLGLSTVAEGIETEAQARFLRDHGCDFGQGYLFGAPMPAREIKYRFGHQDVEISQEQLTLSQAVG